MKQNLWISDLDFGRPSVLYSQVLLYYKLTKGLGQHELLKDDSGTYPLSVQC